MLVMANHGHHVNRGKTAVADDPFTQLPNDDSPNNLM